MVESRIPRSLSFAREPPGSRGDRPSGAFPALPSGPAGVIMTRHGPRRLPPVTPFEPAISIEGPTLLGDSPSPRRIEIDPRSGLIARVDEPRGEADLLLGEDALVMPGLIDLHVHAREDASGQDTYKEDFK